MDSSDRIKSGTGAAHHVEPWLRGTLTELDPVRRAVLHALEMVGEDAIRWCTGLSDAEMNRRPSELAPVAFHLRHIARSLDRLLTYAEGAGLSAGQFDDLRTELEPAAPTASVMAEFHGGLRRASERVKAIAPETFADVRHVGRESLPTTVAGLLIHAAEHTQRHIGQAITTRKALGHLPGAA